MAVLRFADQSYFTSGDWENDLSHGREPVLVDPKWQDTPLAKDLPEALDQLSSALPGQFWMATSGSTGHPKLILKSKKQIASEVEFWKKNLESLFGWSLPKRPRFLVTVPLCHLYGLIWGFALPQSLGIEGKYINPGIANETDISEYDFLISVPYQLKIWKEKNFSLPKQILSSGSKFPVPLAQAFRSEGKVDIREIYGSTETGAIGFRNPMWKARFTLLPQVTAKISNLGDENILEVKSEFVSESCLEYLPDSNQKHRWSQSKLISEDGFFLTMDSGDLSEIGWNYHGRIDRITKIRGKRISLDVVESMIGALGSVTGVAVVTYPKDDEIGLACLLVTEKNLEEIKADLIDVLPASHIPTKIRIVESISKLPNGKIDYEDIKSKLT